MKQRIIKLIYYAGVLSIIFIIPGIFYMIFGYAPFIIAQFLILLITIPLFMPSFDEMNHALWTEQKIDREGGP